MEGCFTFQWGGGGDSFSFGGGGSFSIGVVPHRGALVLMGRVFEKNCWMGGVAPMPPHYGNPAHDTIYSMI